MVSAAGLLAIVVTVARNARLEAEPAGPRLSDRHDPARRDDILKRALDRSGLPALFRDRAQLLDRDHVLVTPHGLLRSNERFGRDHATAASKQFDVDGSGTDNFEIARALHRAGKIDRTELGFQVEIVECGSGPPTMMKSMPASHRRSIKRFSCTTQLVSCSFELQGKLERGWVLQGALVVGVAETHLDEAQVDASHFGFF